MSKRPHTLETTLVAIELLRRIPRSRRVTAAQLHQQLQDAGINRDLRTIQRQLDMLTEHYEIERDERNKPYGYRWKELSQGLSLPLLSEQESLLLLLAEQQLRPLLPSRMMNSLDNFFHQARSDLGASHPGKHARQWLKKVRLVSTTQPLLPPKIEDGVFESVSNALYANRWLEVDYKNATGKRKSASVMPLGLAQQGVRLYLVCRYEGYDEERILALHRILSAQLTDRIFEYPANFDLEQYDADGNFGVGNGKRICLRFCIDKEAGFHLLESPLSQDQQVDVRDDCFEITATLVDTAQLTWWLSGFGEKVWDIRRETDNTAALRHMLT